MWRSTRVRLPSVHRSTDRVITGTAGGWAEQYGVDPTVVRVALALLTFVAGLGAVLYGAMFLLADPPEKRSTPVDEPLDHRRDLAVATGDRGDPGRGPSPRRVAR